MRTLLPMSVPSALILSRRPVAAFVVLGLYWGVFAAHVPVLKAQLGASDALFGLLLLGSSVGLVSAMWLAPRVDRRLGPRGMQAMAWLLALLFLLPATVTQPWLFVLVMALVGMASGLLDVVMNARVSDLEARSGRSLMNANHGMFSLAYAGAAVASGFTREAGVPPAAVFAALGLVTLLLTAGMQMAPHHVARPEAAPAGRWPLWPVLLCGGVVVVAFFAEATVEAWSALHVERTLGGGAAQGALGPATLGLTMALGRFAGQAVVERVRDLTVILWAALLASAGALLAAVAPTPVLAYAGFGVLGLGVSVIGPLGLALAGQIVAPHLRTEAISKVAVMGFAGFSLAPVLIGLVSQVFGLRIAFAGVAAICLLAIPLAQALGRYPARTAQSRA